MEKLENIVLIIAVFVWLSLLGILFFKRRLIKKMGRLDQKALDIIRDIDKEIRR